MKKLIVVALILLVCGCIGEENKDETTTTTLSKTPESFQDVFKIAKEHPYIDSLVEDHNCSPFTWDRVGPMIRVKDWTVVECSEGGADNNFCRDSKIGKKAGESERGDIDRMFGRELEDFYSFTYLCNDTFYFKLFLDSDTLEMANL